MGSNPVESPEFFRFMRQLLKLSSKCEDHIFTKFNNAVLLFDWDSLIVNFKNDTEKLFPSIYNKVNKIFKKHTH